MLSQPNLSGVGQILLAILVTATAIYDIRYRRIPNWLVLAGILVGVIYNSLAFGASGVGSAMEGLGLGFVLYFPLYLIRARGAGDVKLLAAVGAITGPGNCFWIFLLTAVLGGAIALLLVAIRGRLSRTLFNVSWILKDLLRFRAPYRFNEELDVKSSKGMRLPHAAMIFVGAVAFFVMVQYRISV